ncbi:MAG: NAD(P)H-binding protein [Candidatus Dormibacteria bacterium]
MTDSQTSSDAARTVAVTGATGFVGRALIPSLVAAGYTVRRLGRHPETFNRMEGVEDRRFDLDDERPDAAALLGVDTVFYLVHAMGGGGGFAARDRAYAQRFVGAARTAGVRHVIYLGGLYPNGTALSQHLASRREVGDILRSGCGALHVRAGIIIGSGSASFEIMCDLVRRLPVMVTPRWVGNRCQAVDLTDAVSALVRAVDVAGNREIDLAGPDVLTYREMLQRMALALGLRRRLIIGVPVLTPRLSAHWLRFVTSVPLPVAHALVESLRHDALADGSDLFAEVGVVPCGFDEAVRRALANRPGIVRSAHTTFWDGRRYHLTQQFQLSATTRCDSRLLDRVDKELHQLTPRLAPGVLRWHGDELSLAGWSLLRLGSPVHDAATLERTIDGGWLVATPGGVLSFSCQYSSAGPVIEASLAGYSPRLPLIAYVLVQEPVHRALVTSAVRRALSTRRSGDVALRSAPSSQHS